MRITPVILSGGQGTRLWPLSRASMPKQFIPLLFGKSLFEQTVLRVADKNLFFDPLVLCSKDHRFLVKNILSLNYSAQKIIAEPVGRNTAPALCAAALYALQQGDGDDPLLLVLPSDHYIPDSAAFLESVHKAVPLAEGGAIVTFGIAPHRPHTGFGYIEQGDVRGGGFAVRKFHEKPNAIDAQSYVSSGHFFWNAGIFLTKASVYLEELKKFRPDVVESVLRTLEKSADDLADLILDGACFGEVSDISIDVAVMEKTDKACVVPAGFLWDDLGSWDALWDIADKDEHGNAYHGDVMCSNVSNSYLRTDGPLLCAVSVDNLIAVVEQDAVFIGPREKSEDIKKLIAQMKSDGRSELSQGVRCYRPWGYYEVMSESPQYKVKKLSVLPQQRLSLQSHAHRSEHWVVVCGAAHVVKGSDSFDLHRNESVYIPAQTLHRLENKQDSVLEIIEVQTGSYLGEDDIVRYEDDYRRS